MVVAKTRHAMVVKRGSDSVTFYACLYSEPRLYKLPGQDGGQAEHFGVFTLKGRYLAWERVNVEEASNFYPGFLEIADLKTRQRIVQVDAFPDPDEEFGAVTGITQILLRADGAVAWIGSDLHSRSFSVQTLAAGSSTPVAVDAGRNVGRTSLLIADGDPDAFTWMRGKVRKTAPFGGPAPAP